MKAGRGGSWFDRLDASLIRLLFRRERARLRGRGGEAEADRLGERLRRHVVERARVLARLSRVPSLLSPERLILLVTHRCQLRCAYCRVRKFGRDMAESVASRGVKLLFGSPRPRVQLQFFGGEPLMRFGLIRKSVAEAESLRKKTGKSVSYLLTTNGIALDRKILDFLKRRDFTIEFSCDGAMRTHRGQRRAHGNADFYPRIMRNLEALRSSGVPYYVIAVTTPENVGALSGNFRYLADLGHRRIQVNYSLGRLWPPRAVRELLRQLDLIAALAKERGLDFVNATSVRREPTVLNSELTVDCDGGIYRETGICLEEDFARAKRDFFVTGIEELETLDGLGMSPFDNFHLLAEIYGRRNPEWREVIVNNVELGWTVDRHVRGAKRG